MLGGVEHEILYHQAAEIFGRIRKSDFKYVSKKLTLRRSADLSPVQSAAE